MTFELILMNESFGIWKLKVVISQSEYSIIVTEHELFELQAVLAKAGFKEVDGI